MSEQIISRQSTSTTCSWCSAPFQADEPIAEEQAPLCPKCFADLSASRPVRVTAEELVDAGRLTHAQAERFVENVTPFVAPESGKP